MACSKDVEKSEETFTRGLKSVLAGSRVYLQLFLEKHSFTGLGIRLKPVKVLRGIKLFLKSPPKFDD